ncbi:MAG TPA: cation acetate symporter [Solirubrobacteraceae bacterium]|nr:cation acetate symporter [Solirubrobacteraceae bacterium]
MTIFAAELQALPLAVFGIVLAVTLGVTFWASKRTSTATEFFAAGRGISGFQNGWAIAGDYMSASTFLGFAGLIFMFGVDAFVGLAAAIVSFVVVLLFLAERMRNAGKYTLADVLSFRLRERPARMVAALGTLAVASVYLVAQMVGGGVLIQALTGVSFTPAVIVVGAFMLAYVIFGGMLATTWVQIIKAGLLMSAGVVLTVFVLAKFGFNPFELVNRAAEQHPEKHAYLEPGLLYPTNLDLLSFGLAFLLGTAGLPHILIRFFTVPDAKAARGSVGWAVFLIGSFFAMIMLVGMGARAILGTGGEAAAGSSGNLAIPVLAEELGGGDGSTGGELFLAIVSAVALATILAVVAGLVISASGAMAHDLWSNVIRKGRDSEHEEVWVARIAALAIGILSIVIAILGGAGFNVSVLVGLAFCVAASANLPALLFALFWPRFNTTGAIVGVLGGLIASIGLIILSPAVWPGPDSEGSPLGSLGLANPAIFSIPIGFACCWLGTVLSSERGAEREYHELRVRAETGLGAEAASVH